MIDASWVSSGDPSFADATCDSGDVVAILFARRPTAKLKLSLQRSLLGLFSGPRHRPGLREFFSFATVAGDRLFLSDRYSLTFAQP